MTTPTISVPRYATLDMTARYLNCSRRTLERRLNDGSLTPHKFGRLTRLDLNEVDAVMNRPADA